ncbi:MAG: phosphoribosylglycinamide formyltransferase [Bacteroidota bacterium]
MKKIVLFASGSGTNVENIVTYFQHYTEITISCIFTNNAKAGVIDRCKRLEIPLLCFNKLAFSASNVLQDTLLALNPDLIVLAGFLWKVPQKMVHAFPKRIVNIHPALLPKFGGKGMYGNHVHKAVRDSGERYTGITVHFVNEHYDEGAIILQEKVAIQEEDTVETIASKVHQLEYEYYPKVIEQILMNYG